MMALLSINLSVANATEYDSTSKEYQFLVGVFDGCHKEDQQCNSIEKEVDEFTVKITKLYENGKFKQLAEVVEKRGGFELVYRFT